LGESRSRLIWRIVASLTREVWRGKCAVGTRKEGWTNKLDLAWESPRRVAEPGRKQGQQKTDGKANGDRGGIAIGR